jgi:hypothetical protein
MDYLITNALEIMYLCLGGGFLILVIVASKFLLTLNRTIGKINYFADVFGDYVRKPLEVLAQINDYVAPVIEMFNGKKR